MEFFQWCDDHPLLEEDVAVYQGDVTRFDKKKVRPYTLRGLAIYLNISVARLERYRAGITEFSTAMELIDQIIHTQKFENAAAGILNASIISRDLGLADKQELTGANGADLVTRIVIEAAYDGSTD
jgi:hypothetical protein